MPKTDVLLFRDEDGSVPLTDWLDTLPKKAQAKCVGALRRLELLGHELRRPEADYLRDDIFELRIGLQGVNYRMLYFFASSAESVGRNPSIGPSERGFPPVFGDFRCAQSYSVSDTGWATDAQYPAWHGRTDFFLAIRRDSVTTPSDTGAMPQKSTHRFRRRAIFFTDELSSSCRMG